MSADAWVGSNPIASVDASLRVPLTDTQKAAYTMTSVGLENVYFSPRTDSTWETLFYFKDPSEIGPGVYRDTVRVGLCTDVDCTALKAGTISTVSVTYTVTGTVQPPPGVSASTNSVTVSAMAHTDEQPRVTVPLTYLNERANRSFTVTTSSAYLGTLNSQVTSATPAGANLEITFRSAWMLQPGVYDDVVTVDVCSKCPAPVEGSPLTIHTRYTITDTANGSNGYRIRLLPHAASELAWDANQQRLYLAVPASAAANASSLIAVDPQTGAITGSVDVGMDPSQLSVSADGRFAYVGSGKSNVIRRFKLPDMTADITVPLGTGDWGDLAGGDIQVSPYDADLVSVERLRSAGDGNHLDIALISNGLLRPDIATDVSDQVFYGLQWADPAHLYASLGNNSAIATISIAGGEISSHSITPLTGTASASDGRSHWDGFFLYRDNGEKVDVLNARVEGIYIGQSPGDWVRAVVPDAGLNRLFALVSVGASFNLQSYTLDTKVPVASVPLIGVPLDYRAAPQLIRFGPNGLAANTTDGRVLLVEGAFVAP